MKENLKEYAFNSFINFLPLIASAVFIMAEYAEVSFAISKIGVLFGLASVFFWTFQRPDVFGALSVMFLGVLADFLNYTPLGTNMFSFLLLYVLEIKISLYLSNKIFVVNLASFALSSLVVLVVQWFVLSVYYLNFLPFFETFFSWLFTVCLYPLIARINLYLSEKFKAEDFE